MILELEDSGIEVEVYNYSTKAEDEKLKITSMMAWYEVVDNDLLFPIIILVDDNTNVKYKNNKVIRLWHGIIPKLNEIKEVLN